MYIPPNAGFKFSEFVSKYKSVTPTARGVGNQAAQTALNNVLGKITVSPDINSRINSFLAKTPITNVAGNLSDGWDIASRVQGIYGVLSGAVTPVSPNMNILNNLINGALDNLLGGKSFDKTKDSLLFGKIIEELTKYQTENLPFYSRSNSLPTMKLGLFDDSKWMVRMETPKSSLECGVPYPPYNIPDNVDKKYKYSDTEVNFGTGYVPCTMVGQYELKEGKTEELQIVDQLNISIPSNLMDKYLLNIEVLNDQYNTVFNYMNAYRDALYPDYRTALPYKNAVTIIELWILSRQKFIFQKYRLLGILQCSMIKVTGTNRPTTSTIPLNFDIVGELEDGEELNIYDNKVNIYNEEMNRIIE